MNIDEEGAAALREIIQSHPHARMQAVLVRIPLAGQRVAQAKIDGDVAAVAALLGLLVPLAAEVADATFAFEPGPKDEVAKMLAQASERNG